MSWTTSPSHRIAKTETLRNIPTRSVSEGLRLLRFCSRRDVQGRDPSLTLRVVMGADVMSQQDGSCAYPNPTRERGIMTPAILFPP